jgi:hypothetical protein
MAVLRRIAPASAFKVGLVSYALVGLIPGIFCTLIAVTGASFAPHEHLPFMRTVGLFALVVCPLVYGIIGGVVTLVGVLIYNLVSSWVGGFEVELS